MTRQKIVRLEKLKREVVSYALVLLGAIILSIGYSLFIIPHDIVPGGVFGLGIVMNEWSGISVGSIALFINIPILLWGTKMLGKKTGLKTLFFMVAISFLVDAFAYVLNNQIIVKDILVSAIFGGLLIGLSVHIVKYAGATTGGSDIVARILTKRLNIEFSRLILLMNVVIILLGVITFGDFTMTAYCLITIVVSTKTISYFIKKGEQNKTVIIFSKSNDEIQEEIAKNDVMRKDVVKVIHKDSSEKMILVTKGMRKLPQIENIIYKTDPKAQIVSLESNKSLV